MNKSTEPKENKKRWKIYIPLILVISIVVVLIAVWYSKYSSYISTDDAYLDSDRITVSSQIMGRILGENAGEGDTVREGQLLAVLDSSDLIAHRAQAETQKTQAIAAKGQALARLAYEEESIKVVEIENEKSKEDFERSQKQYEGSVITLEQFEHSRKAMEAAKARLSASQSQLKVAKSMIGSAEAAIKNAEAQVAVLSSQVEKTRIFAPADGIIAKRWMLSGEVAQPGQAMMTITKNHDLWVMVYLEETKLKNVHLGQDVNFTVDAYPDVDFSGSVFYIGSNTASQFSLIPAGNASGNFTKVTQRVPLKVSIGKIGDRPDHKPVELLAGMSVEIKILK